MMKNEPTNQELIDLILDHAENQGITMDEDALRGYSLEGLYDVLLDLEDQAIHNTPMPKY